jgi:hypothetical protein
MTTILISFICVWISSLFFQKRHRLITSQLESALKRQDELEFKIAQMSDWQPIDTFDHRMFSIMSNGLEDYSEVVKYKGEVPEWALLWHPFPPINRKLANAVYAKATGG